jgi:hypothetical protein
MSVISGVIQQFPQGRVRSGKPAGLMVLSVYPIGEMREIEPPSDGKGSGALCAVVDIDGERAPACSVHLDEVDPKVRNAEGEVVFSAEPQHRLPLYPP